MSEKSKLQTIKYTIISFCGKQNEKITSNLLSVCSGIKILIGNILIFYTLKTGTTVLLRKGNAFFKKNTLKKIEVSRCIG